MKAFMDVGQGSGRGTTGVAALEGAAGRAVWVRRARHGVPTRGARLDLAGVTTTVGLSRTVGACPMRAWLRSSDV